MSTTIRVSNETKTRLQEMGVKGQSYDDIIMAIYHQRNILAIHEICSEMPNLEENETLSLSTVHQVFDTIGYLIPDAPTETNLKGENWYNHTTYDDAQRLYREHIIEMSMDEDIVGHDVAMGYRKLPVGEAITNVYCLFEDIPAPQWHMSVRMKNPFSP